MSQPVRKEDWARDYNTLVRRVESLERQIHPPPKYVSVYPENPYSGQEIFLLDATDDTISHLFYDGTLWRSVSSIQRVTSLPTTDLYVGRRIVYVEDAANGVYWDLVLTDPNETYPWVYVGGPPLVNTVDTFGTRLSATYGDLSAGTGPVVTPSLAGDYVIEYGAHIRNDTANQDSFISFSVGATAALDADSTQNWSSSANGAGWGQGKVLVKTIPAAAQAIQLKYKSTAGTASYRNRWLKVTPVRLG